MAAELVADELVVADEMTDDRTPDRTAAARAAVTPPAAAAPVTASTRRPPRREFLWMSDGMRLRIAVVVGITLMQLPSLLQPPPLPTLQSVAKPLALPPLPQMDGRAPVELSTSGPLAVNWAGLPASDAAAEAGLRWQAALAVLARGTRDDPQQVLERLVSVGPVYLVQYSDDDSLLKDQAVGAASRNQELLIHSPQPAAARLGMLVVDRVGVRAVIGDASGSTRSLQFGPAGLALAAASRIRLLDIKNGQRSYVLSAPAEHALPLADVFRTQPGAPGAFVATR